MAELERDFASVALNETQVRQLRDLLASYTLPDQQRQRLEQLIAGNQASTAPPPVKPAPKTQGYTKDELEAIEIVRAVQRGEIPAPLPPEETPKPSYPPGYKPNPRIEAIYEDWKRRNQK
jgi:23S rRNA-/tRNA-specific pseudouridylate synthase